MQAMLFLEDNSPLMQPDPLIQIPGNCINEGQIKCPATCNGQSQTSTPSNVPVLTNWSPTPNTPQTPQSQTPQTPQTPQAPQTPQTHFSQITLTSNFQSICSQPEDISFPSNQSTISNCIQQCQNILPIQGNSVQLKLLLKSLTTQESNIKILAEYSDLEEVNKSNPNIQFKRTDSELAKKIYNFISKYFTLTNRKYEELISNLSLGKSLQQLFNSTAGGSESYEGNHVIILSAEQLKSLCSLTNSQLKTKTQNIKIKLQENQQINSVLIICDYTAETITEHQLYRLLCQNIMNSIYPKLLNESTEQQKQCFMYLFTTLELQINYQDGRQPSTKQSKYGILSCNSKENQIPQITRKHIKDLIIQYICPTTTKQLEPKQMTELKQMIQKSSIMPTLLKLISIQGDDRISKENKLTEFIKLLKNEQTVYGSNSSDSSSDSSSDPSQFFQSQQSTQDSSGQLQSTQASSGYLQSTQDSSGQSKQELVMDPNQQSEECQQSTEAQKQTQPVENTNLDSSASN